MTITAGVAAQHNQQEETMPTCVESMTDTIRSIRELATEIISNLPVRVQVACPIDQAKYPVLRAVIDILERRNTATFAEILTIKPDARDILNRNLHLLGLDRDGKITCVAYLASGDEGPRMLWQE